jgi:hypothetical protein
MHVLLQPSPSVSHKYRVLFPDKRAIDFGIKSVRHYPDHGNPSLMRAHLIKKGAIVPEKLRLETDPFEIHREMLKIQKSTLEDWDDQTVSEYWERWILWSYPSVHKAKLYMTMNQGVLFVQGPGDL